MKRFTELTFLKLWVVPTAIFFIAAAGFAGGAIAERNRNTSESGFFGSAMTEQITTGVFALGIYSWIFGLAVKDAVLKEKRKEPK